MNNPFERIDFLCGLHNIGNTCYMNSVLQIFVHNKILQKHFLTQEFKDGLMENVTEIITKRHDDITDKNIVGHEILNTVTCQFYKLLMAMKHDHLTSPHQFKYVLSTKNETYSGFSQNDSHELINYLLDTLHEETKCKVELCLNSFPQEYNLVEATKRHFVDKMNSVPKLKDKMIYATMYGSFEASHQREVTIHSGISYWASYIEKNFSVVSQYFTGVYHSDITCAQCKNINHTFEIFTTLSLEIPNSENVCNNIFPPTLNDCLDGFTSTEKLTDKYKCDKCMVYTEGTKTMSFWNLPEILIIHYKRFKSEQTHNSVQSRKISAMIEYPLTLDMTNYMCEYNRKPTQYELTSVIHHYGQCNCGHYVSFSKINNNWFLFNDGNITHVSNVEREIMTDSTYIMVYELKH